MGQLDLFPRPEPTSVAVEPATVPEELRDLASRLPASVRLGTSSWSFPGWRGLVYRDRAEEAELARDGLAAYGRHPLLRAVGIDRTFYAPVKAADFARYAAAVPGGFRFLVKASQACTFPALRGGAGAGNSEPNPRFLDPAFAADEVVGPATEGLRGQLGTILFQFPPLPAALTRRAAEFADRLGEFLARLPAGPLYSVEIRNRSLLTPGYAAALAPAGASHAFTVHPSMPPLPVQAAVVGLERQPALVVRWMLGHGRGYEEARLLYEPFDRLVAPDEASRSSIASLAARALGLAKEVLVVVNNKAEGSAPLSVVGLARAIASSAGR